jgi:ElaB/YqjD/DUF883 family membrane-anchored ribosome-binding protein
MNKGALKSAEAVLARVVVQPRMDALAALADAARVGTDPEETRRIARQRADELAERARQRGQEVLQAARQRYQELQQEAARQGRELKAQAEANIKTHLEQWHATYRAAQAAGWTVEELEEVGFPPPPPRLSRRPARRRARPDAHVRSGQPVATTDSSEEATFEDQSANGPA